MQTDKTTTLATAIVTITGAFWGFYWMPLRALDAAGLVGAWATLAITVAAFVLLLVPAMRQVSVLRAAHPVALASLMLGGAAFTLYSIALIHGRVAMIILLFFLTPVWSTLIGRYVMGWPTPRMRVAAIVVGIAGLFVMLSAKGQTPIPQSSGEWMALLAGMLWAVASTGIRVKSTLPPVPANFVFVLGAMLTTLVLALALQPLPQALPGGLALVTALSVGTGAVWWALSLTALMWATLRLEPARGGILLMIEVLIGGVSAALLAGEHLAPMEMAGGALVLIAAALEVWPIGRRTMNAA